MRKLIKRDLITKEGFSFAFDKNACEKCESKCCAGESGNVWVGESEIREIALFLKMDFHIARAMYFREEREGFRVKEIRGERGLECAFLGESGCKIYDSRPRQCKTFPFWDGAEEIKNILAVECDGIVI